jgi:antitoxin ParD1/3/4
MHISLPPALKEWVQEQVEQGGFGTASEYVRDLLRAERERQLRARIDRNLHEALDSGEATPVTPETWRQTRERVKGRLRKSSRKRRTDGSNR